MVKNTDFLGTMSTNPFNFRHFDLNHFALYVNERQIPPEGLSQDMSREKIAIMGYRTLFDGSDIIIRTQDSAKYINRIFHARL